MSSEMYFESFPADGQATCIAHWMYGLYGANTNILGTCYKGEPEDDVKSEVPGSLIARTDVQAGMQKEHIAPGSGRFQGCIEGQNSNLSSLFRLETAAYSLIGVTLPYHGICYLIGLDLGYVNEDIIGTRMIFFSVLLMPT